MSKNHGSVLALVAASLSAVSCLQIDSHEKESMVVVESSLVQGDPADSIFKEWKKRINQHHFTMKDEYTQENEWYTRSIPGFVVTESDHKNLDVLLTKIADLDPNSKDNERALMGGECLMALDDKRFDPALIATVMYHGFLPIATEWDTWGPAFLLPKMHEERCILDPLNTHVMKKLKKVKKTSPYRMTIDTDFQGVIDGCIENTWSSEKDDNWLKPEYVEGIRAVNASEKAQQLGVRVHTVELWHKETGELVAGELGYSVGSIYSSLTGFCSKKHSGAGSVQLASLGALLAKAGYQIWDMGMGGMQYKYDLNARPVPRRVWIENVRRFRDEQPLGNRLQDAFGQEHNEWAVESLYRPKKLVVNAADSRGGINNTGDTDNNNNNTDSSNNNNNIDSSGNSLRKLIQFVSRSFNRSGTISSASPSQQQQYEEPQHESPSTTSSESGSVDLSLPVTVGEDLHLLLKTFIEKQNIMKNQNRAYVINSDDYPVEPIEKDGGGWAQRHGHQQQTTEE